MCDLSLTHAQMDAPTVRKPVITVANHNGIKLVRSF